MELLKRIIKGLVIAFFALMTLVAFAGLKSPLGGVLFLLGGALFTPFGRLITEKLPKFIHPAIFIGTTAFVLFIAACCASAGGKEKNVDNNVAESSSDENVDEGSALESDMTDEGAMRLAESDNLNSAGDNGSDLDTSISEDTQETVQLEEDEDQNQDNSGSEISTLTEVEDFSDSGSTDLETVVDETVAETAVDTPSETPYAETSLTETTTAVADQGSDNTQVETTPVQSTIEPAVDNTPSTMVTYVLNTNTMKCHVPSCSSVRNIKPENRQDFYGTAAEARAMGYDACGNCRPW